MANYYKPSNARKNWKSLFYFSSNSKSLGSIWFPFIGFFGKITVFSVGFFFLNRSENSDIFYRRRFISKPLDFFSRTERKHWNTIFPVRSLAHQNAHFSLSTRMKLQKSTANDWKYEEILRKSHQPTIKTWLYIGSFFQANIILCSP